MGKEIITLGNIEVEKHKVHQHKNSILINDADITKIVVSSKFAFGKKAFKYFTGYENDYVKTIPLKSDSHPPKKVCFISFNEGPLKMVKNAFYFILKALFILNIFKCLS